MANNSIRPLSPTRREARLARLRGPLRLARRGRPADSPGGVHTTIVVIRLGSIAASRAISRIASRRPNGRSPSASMTSRDNWWTKAIHTRDAKEHRIAIRRRIGGTIFSLIRVGSRNIGQRCSSLGAMPETRRGVGIGNCYGSLAIGHKASVRSGRLCHDSIGATDHG